MSWWPACTCGVLIRIPRAHIYTLSWPDLVKTGSQGFPSLTQSSQQLERPLIPTDKLLDYPNLDWPALSLRTCSCPMYMYMYLYATCTCSLACPVPELRSCSMYMYMYLHATCMYMHMQPALPCPCVAVPMYVHVPTCYVHLDVPTFYMQVTLPTCYMRVLVHAHVGSL